MDSLINIIVSVLLTAISEIFRTRSSQKYRELTVIVEEKVSSDDELMHPGLKEFKDLITIQYSDKDLSGASVVHFSLTNSGKTLINKTDFESPAKFFFGPDAQLAEAKLIGCKPLALEHSVIIAHDQNSLTIDPLLLNRGESILIAVLGTNIEFVKPVIRLVGLSEIEPTETRRLITSLVRNDREIARTVLFLFGFSLLLMLIAFSIIYARSQ